jgi:hypothetical protein
MASTPVSGSCFCGAVRFEVELPTLWCAHCHCSMCRRSHGAAFVTWFGVLRSQLRMVAGEKKLARHKSSDHGVRSFCKTCGSSLFCELDEHKDQIDVVLANMAGEIDRGPQLHVFFGDRVDWVELGDALPRAKGSGA